MTDREAAIERYIAATRDLEPVWVTRGEAMTWGPWLPYLQKAWAEHQTGRVNMWTRYRVRLDFMTRMYGSVPSDPEVVAAWIKARINKARVRAPGARTTEEINEEVLASIERGEQFSEADSNILVFQRHDGKCSARFDTIRAHIKDCARQISGQHVGYIQGERAFSTRVINGCYTDPAQYWVPILRPDGGPVTKHDGEVDKFVHLKTGPNAGNNALKRLEWIEPARLDFTLLVLVSIGNKPSVAEDDLHKIFTYGGIHGYGGERSTDGGKYTYRIEHMEDGRAEDPQRGGAVRQAGTTPRRR